MNKNKLFSSIETNPKIQGGAPVLVGTRVTVSEVLACLADGWTVGEIVNSLRKLDDRINEKMVGEVILFAKEELDIKYSQ